MLELIKTETGYIDSHGQPFVITGGNLLPANNGLGIAPVVIAAAITGSVKLIQLIGANKGLNEARALTGEYQLILDTLLEQNRQLDLQIAQMKEAFPPEYVVKVFGMTIIKPPSLGGLEGWCLFNCRKKAAEAESQENIQIEIKKAEEAQLQKITILNKLQRQLEDIAGGKTEKTAKMGWIATGILASALVGSYFLSEKKKKGKKPVKKDAKK